MKAVSFLTAGAMALLAGCAGKPEPEPAARPEPQPVRPQPAPTPAPPPLQGWQDLPLTPGAWVYSRDASGSQAVFGPPASEAFFVVRCEAGRRQIVLSREGTSARPQLRIRTSALERTLAATARVEPLAYLSATLPATDPLLDAIVFSRGRFTVEAEGVSRLVLPAWPEPARVVEDCRD